MAQDIQQEIYRAIQNEEALEKLIERKAFFDRAWIKKINK